MGDARVTLHPAAGTARALLALGHGAGGGIGAADLVELARALPAAGITVALVEQPWRVAGKKVGPLGPTLDKAWVPVMAELAREGLPLFGGGRSAGARVACRTAMEVGVAGVVALAFPLHPPGRPDRSRADELLGSGCPTLVLQGARDPFGGPDEFPELPDTHTLVAVPEATHSFRRRAELDLIAATAGAWLTSKAG